MSIRLFPARLVRARCRLSLVTAAILIYGLLPLYRGGRKVRTVLGWLMMLCSPGGGADHPTQRRAPGLFCQAFAMALIDACSTAAAGSCCRPASKAFALLICLSCRNYPP